jgi:hypothetical protein
MKRRRESTSYNPIPWGQGVLVLAACAVGPANGQTAEIRMTVLSSPSGSDTAATVPASATYMLNDTVFVVEVWAQTSSPSGLSSVSTDVTFTTALADVTSITHTAAFNVLTHGTIDNVGGIINDFSGSHLGACTDAVGAAPNWARAAVLNVTPSVNGTLVFQSGPTGSAVYGTAVCGVGDLADASITFGSVTVTLVDCVTSGDCDDGLYCSGMETCNPATHTCQAGAPPNCDDGVACTIDVCNEATDSCTHTPDDAACDNGLWCDGAEYCDAVLGCQDGAAPCVDPCEHCVEADDACDWCVLDLDSSAVMGTGDFAHFAACFGACFVFANPCYASNFDGSVDGCVGSSDFAVFASCFGFECAQCAACAGAPGGAASIERIEATVPTTAVAVHVAVVEHPIESDVVAAPPPSIERVGVGQAVFVEVWASRINSSPGDTRGLASVYTNLQYNPRLLAIDGVQPGALFGNFAGGADDGAGIIARLGGCAALGERKLGGDGDWVRVATVRARTKAAGRGRLAAESSDVLHGVAILGEYANVRVEQIEFGESPLVIGELKPDVPRMLRGGPPQ